MKSLLKNLIRLVAAPLDIIDKLEVEPLTDVAEAVAKSIKGKP